MAFASQAAHTRTRNSLTRKKTMQCLPVIEQCEPRLLMSAIAYEGFEYSVGTLTGAALGSGWADGSGWGGASTAAVVSGSLASESSPSSTMTTHGNSASVCWQQTATRNLDVSGGPLVQAGETLWVSFVVNNVDSPDNYDASLRLDSASGPIWLGTPYAGTYSLTTGSDWVAGTGTPPVDGTSHLIVAKIQYLSGTNSAGGNAIVSVWADPTLVSSSDPGVAEPVAAAGSLVNYNISATISSPTAVGLSAGDIFYGSANFDEIRIGTTYADVGPAAPIFGAPSNLTTIGSSSGVTLNWVDNSDVETGFSIIRSTSEDFSNPTIFSVGPNQTTDPLTSYTDTTADLGTVYYYQAVATGTNGNSPASNPAYTPKLSDVSHNLRRPEEPTTPLDIYYRVSNMQNNVVVMKITYMKDGRAASKLVPVYPDENNILKTYTLETGEFDIGTNVTVEIDHWAPLN